MLFGALSNGVETAQEVLAIDELYSSGVDVIGAALELSEPFRTEPAFIDRSDGADELVPFFGTEACLASVLEIQNSSQMSQVFRQQGCPASCILHLESCIMVRGLPRWLSARRRTFSETAMGGRDP